MKRKCMKSGSFAIGLAMMLARWWPRPVLRAADPATQGRWISTDHHQTIARGLNAARRAVLLAGGGISGPTRGTGARHQHRRLDARFDSSTPMPVPG